MATKKQALSALQEAEGFIRQGKGQSAICKIGAAKAIVSELREPASPTPPSEPPKEEAKPPAEQPKGKVLFQSPGLLSDMNLGGSGSGKLIQGDGYIESQLTGTGSTMGERAEYAYDMPDLSSGTVLDEFEVEVVPGHMIWPTNGMHNLITQFKSNGTGSPAAALYLWGSTPTSGRAASGKGLWTSLSFSGAAGDTFRAPFAEGGWHNVAVEYIGISNKAEGRMRLSVDGAIVFEGGIGGSLIIPGQSSAYIKHGLYRNPGLSGDGWIRQRNFRCTLLG